MLSLLNDPRGFLGTDTGGKVATLRVMAQGEGFDPDVGYWAETWDPAGRFHPLYYTNHLAGKWVNVTTLPALYVAYPLYDLAGYRGALLVPMAGSILAALAARALARRLGATDGRQWAAFWIVGLASPLAVYALDFWEHSIGLGLVAWGVVLLYDVAFEPARRPWLNALGAGLLFGTAATMRTEALVYGAVASAASLAVWLWRRRTLVGPVVAGVAVAAGLVVPLAANVALERATIGTSLRAERAAGAVASAAGGGGANRTEEAVITGLALEPSAETAAYLVGAVLLVLLVLLARRSAREGGDPRLASLLFAGVVALYVIRFANGLGFIPGMIAAVPLAGFGLAWAWHDTRCRLIAAIAVVALPLVWRLQYTGGAAPQWAGRYILTSGFLLLVIGVIALARLERWVGVAMVVLSGTVTAFGVGWLVERSHDTAHAGAFLARRPEPVLVSRVGHLFREAGAYYAPDRQWLTAPTEPEVEEAAGVVSRAGFDRFGLVTVDDDSPPLAIPGYRPLGTDRFVFISGVPMRVTTYERAP